MIANETYIHQRSNDVDDVMILLHDCVFIEYALQLFMIPVKTSRVFCTVDCTCAVKFESNVFLRSTHFIKKTDSVYILKRLLYLLYVYIPISIPYTDAGILLIITRLSVPSKLVLNILLGNIS